MAVVLGISSGFVTVAPSADPAGGQLVEIESNLRAQKDTSPSDATKIVEIGWWCNENSSESNYEVAIYTHHSGNNKPDAVVGIDATNAKGTSSGWKRATGLNISISGSTIYWIGIQLDAMTGGAYTDRESDAGERYSRKVGGQTFLPDLWPADSSETADSILSIYAVYETEAPSGQPTMKRWGQIPAMDFYGNR